MEKLTFLILIIIGFDKSKLYMYKLFNSYNWLLIMFVNSNENEKSFIDLYEKYLDKIYNYIYKSILNKEITEDLTSNTFLKALDFLKKNDNKIDNFSAWLYKIATNEILLYFREKKGKQTLYYDSEEFIFNNISKSNSESSIDYIMLKDAMKKLNPQEMLIMELHYFENLDYSEITQIVNIKENTLRSIIHRCLKKLNKILGTEEKYEI